MPADDKRMPMLQEKYRVPHFDAKAEANAYFAGVPATFLRDVVLLGQPLHVRPGAEEGRRRAVRWTFPMGNAKLAGIAAEDIGKAAYGIFKAGDQYIGKTVGIAGESLTIERDGPEAVEGPRHRTGEVQRRRAPTCIASFGFPGADEMGNMFQVYRDFEKEMLANRNLDEARKLNPALQTFDQFVNKNKDKIMAAANPAPAGTTA